VLKILARSLVATGAATATDLGALFVMVTLFGVAPRVASVPALLLAAVVQFTAQRRFAFRATTGLALDQALQFVALHAMTLFLNALLFDAVVQLAIAPYWLVRVGIGNVVYFGWSFPMLKRTFGDRPLTTS
jgi:putative flippase GtrA